MQKQHTVHRIGRIVLSVTLLLAFTGCSDNTPQPPGVVDPKDTLKNSPETAEQFNPDGATMVFVVDTSGSMGRYDPWNIAVEIPQVAVASGSDSDNVGVVRFSIYADIVSKLQALASNDKRSILLSQISELANVRSGSSEFVQALQKTREMLDSVQAKEGSAAIFLTDGNPDEGQDLEILHEVDRYMRRKWKIYIIGLSNRTQTQIMRQMAARTGGAFYRIETMEEALNAYLEIAQNLQNYWYYSGATPQQVPVLAGTKRLVYIALKKSQDGQLTQILRDGQPVQLDPEDMTRFPRNAKERTTLHAMNIVEPASGEYSPEMTAGMELAKVLIEPAYNIRFRKNFPPDIMYQSDPLAVEVIVSAPDIDTLRRFVKNGTISAEIRRDKTGGLLLDPIQLRPGVIDEEALTVSYSGEERFSKLSITTEEIFNLQLNARVKAGDGGEWVRRFIRKINYRPTERQRIFALLPGPSRELPPTWNDAESLNAKFTVSCLRGETARFNIRMMQPRQGTPKPETGMLSEEGATHVTIQLHPKELPIGDAVVRFFVSGSSSEGDAPEQEGRIFVPVYEFKGPESIDLFALREGLETPPDQKTFWPGNSIRTQAIPISVNPDTLPLDKFFTTEIVPNPDAKDATAMLNLHAELSADSIRIIGKAPDDVRGGDFSGAVVFKSKIGGLAERRIPFHLEVQVPKPELVFADDAPILKQEGHEIIQINALEKQVWTKPVRLEFTPKRIFGGTLEVVASDIIIDEATLTRMTATGDPLGRRIRVQGICLTKSGEEKWNLLDLREGERYAILYSVLVSSDYPDRDFWGTLTLRVKRDNKVVLEQKIDVKLQVMPDEAN